MFLDNKVYWLSRNSHQHTTASWFLLRKSARHCTHVALSHRWQPRDLRMGECICGFPDRFIYSFLRWNKVQGECSVIYSSVQFSCSVVSDSLRLHESQHARPPFHHQLPEFTQTHVHRVSDAIQPSHPLSSPSPPAPNPSQYQGGHNRSLY